MSADFAVTPSIARAFARRALLLDAPQSSIGSVLSYLGHVQLDPLNVCGRVHDLILRNRVVGYEEGSLLRYVHGQHQDPNEPQPGRVGFEHYLPSEGILVAWPREAYPFVRAYLDRIYPKEITCTLPKNEAVLADKIIEEISVRGPLTSDDIEHEGRGQTAWGTNGRLVKIVLEKLFAAGRLLIAARRNFRRVYDLPSRVIALPKLSVLPTDEEVNRWRILLRFRQRRLVTIRRGEQEALGDLLQPVRIENGPLVCCLREDRELLKKLPDSHPSAKCQLLAPLDPLIYDRKLTRSLWNFDFTWEVYTPASARKRGYYSLPVLAGLEIVGDIEPRADRKRGRLVVVSRRVKRGFPTSDRVRELATFLGLR